MEQEFCAHKHHRHINFAISRTIYAHSSFQTGASLYKRRWVSPIRRRIQTEDHCPHLVSRDFPSNSMLFSGAQLFSVFLIF